METSNIPEASISDTFRILLATDIHLGYAENDPERGDDSFNSFEEILQLAKAHKVDFLLLGGDLFHENKPSNQCLYKCLSLLREYCMGDDPISIEFLSDQHVNFQHCRQPLVNYEDPNLNISIPVFSIHGNHDDPSGQKQLCSLDILSTCGLVNYFGKWTDLKEVKISPILLKKGKSKLALYGLSHIKDERLSRLFRDHKVHMYRPSEDTDNWFNIFVCHQNRVDRGINKHVPEEALPQFLDLVVWGHEHECLIQKEFNAIQGFYVTQPGSSVATSLSEGESKEKCVGLLQVWNKKFELQPIPLKTVRPFIFESIKLSQCTIPVTESTSNSVQLYLEDRIEFWLEEATRQFTGHERQPKLPLLRVRVEYTDEAQCFNTIRFGQKYQSRVANPDDMILLKREKTTQRKSRENDEDDKENMQQFLQNEEVTDIWEVKMNVLMQKYFDEISTKKLQVFSVKGISEAAARFIDKSDKESIKMIVEHQMNKIEQHLCKSKVDVDHIDEEIEKFMKERLESSASEVAEIQKILDSIHPPPKKEEENDVSVIQDSDNDEDNDITTEMPVVPEITRGRGRGGRASRGRAVPRTSTSRARGRARGTQGTSRVSAIQKSNETGKRNATQTTLSNYLMYDDEDTD